MSITEIDTSPAAELRAHQRTFHAFERLVLFASIHVALVLGALALAFFGHAPVIATLLGVGGTLVLIAAFAVTGSQVER